MASPQPLDAVLCTVGSAWRSHVCDEHPLLHASLPLFGCAVLKAIEESKLRSKGDEVVQARHSLQLLGMLIRSSIMHAMQSCCQRLCVQVHTRPVCGLAAVAAHLCNPPAAAPSLFLLQAEVKRLLNDYMRVSQTEVQGKGGLKRTQG